MSPSDKPTAPHDPEMVRGDVTGPDPVAAADAIDPARAIAFQGMPGAYSDLACRTVFPGLTTVPCHTFADAFEAVSGGRAAKAMIPIENSVAGRVADVHHIIPDGGLHIVGEHFQRIVHHLLAVPGAALDDIKTVHSHVHALGQCRQFLRQHGLNAVVHVDTAGAAIDTARKGDPTQAAIASSLAGEVNGLASLATDIADTPDNTTRFLVLAPEPAPIAAGNGPTVTTFVFRVRSVPAALYKALGGFATNGVNMTKLESYIVDARFTAAQFYADVEGHPDDPGLKLALEELQFFATELRILGTYPANPFRSDGAPPADVSG